LPSPGHRRRFTHFVHPDHLFYRESTSPAAKLPSEYTATVSVKWVRGLFAENHNASHLHLIGRLEYAVCACLFVYTGTGHNNIIHKLGMAAGGGGSKSSSRVYALQPGGLNYDL
jgi:hypothetical protein